jgi:hypothetical protein
MLIHQWLSDGIVRACLLTSLAQWMHYMRIGFVYMMISHDVNTLNLLAFNVFPTLAMWQITQVAFATRILVLSSQHGRTALVLAAFPYIIRFV